MSSIIKGFLGHFPAQVHPPLSLPPPPQKKKKSTQKNIPYIGGNGTL